MRKYEYRGVDIYTNQMVYGQYIEAVDSHIICSSDDIVPYGCEYWYGIDCSHYVDPETVGEYTGIKDVYGNKIYVGDIVEIEFDMFFMNFGLNKHIEEHGNIYKFIGKVEYFDGRYIVDNNSDEGYDLFREMDELRVIGNIYENSDLLEGR